MPENSGGMRTLVSLPAAGSVAAELSCGLADPQVIPVCLGFSTGPNRDGKVSLPAGIIEHVSG